MVTGRQYEILRSQVDLSPMPPIWRAVAEAVIVGTADLDYAVDLITDETFLRDALKALRDGAPVVAGDAMTAAGVTGHDVLCLTGEPAAARMARAAGITPAAAAIRLAYAEVGRGAVWLIGAEPTALLELVARDVAPALVIGVPAGLDEAAAAKQAVRAARLPAITNISGKGGPSVATAAFNALLSEA